MKEEIYQQIWAEVSDMQDLRDDKGHGKTVLEFAEKLVKIFKGNREIVVPAAIFHDTGYYGMNREILRDMMAGKLSEEVTKEIKKNHMKKGGEIAKTVLTKLNYNPQLIGEIVRIVENHDLDNEPQTLEEKIVRDADKLWRYSSKGFNLDVKRRNWPSEKWYSYLKGNLDKPNYFYTKEAREIASKELEKRIK